MNKTKFILIVMVLAYVVFLIGCTAQGGSPPPSGPIGGGCG